jgi:ribosomal protein S27AE
MNHLECNCHSPGGNLVPCALHAERSVPAAPPCPRCGSLSFVLAVHGARVDRSCSQCGVLVEKGEAQVQAHCRASPPRGGGPTRPVKGQQTDGTQESLTQALETLTVVSPDPAVLALIQDLAIKLGATVTADKARDPPRNDRWGP